MENDILEALEDLGYNCGMCLGDWLAVIENFCGMLGIEGEIVMRPDSSRSITECELCRGKWNH